VNLLWIGCLVASLSVTEIPIGTELQYTGTLSPQSKSGQGNTGADDKTFAVTAVAISDSDGAPQLAWNLEERGGGSWTWPERFGAIAVAPNGKPNSPVLRLLQTHDAVPHPVAIRSPLFESLDKLAPDASWSDGRLEFRVARKRRVKDRDCWQVEVVSNQGRSQSLLVDASTGILVSLEQRVFMGRGDEYQLKMELQSQKVLSGADVDKTQTAFTSLRRLQGALERTGEQKVVEPTPPQLKAAQGMIAPIERQAEGTMWAKLTAIIARDLVQQERRLEGAAGLAKKFIGQVAPKSTLKFADGTTISTSDLQGKVAVLHFWEYRNENLAEPYGQTGYLDFLNGKRKKLGVKVIGVNVDPRIADRDNSAAAVRSMKKLQEFMNLAYDVAIDDGTVLGHFGDPRSLGSPLPLWIVIGPDGKINHYHVGFYNITPDEGLKELDEAVIAALRKQREAK